jgi:hypothetical protein
LNDLGDLGPVSRSGFGAQDLENYAAAVHTGPDFGCVLWTVADLDEPSEAEMDGVKTRRQCILDTTRDLVADFLHYNRKEDEELPRGAIEEAVKAGEITKAEIVSAFAEALGDLQGD